MTYNQLTKEEINKKLEDKKIFVSGDYINSKENTEFTCMLCNNKFNSRYDLVRYWKYPGCKNCGNSNRQNHHKVELTNRKESLLYSKKSDKIEIISYDDEIKDITCRCLICRKEYKTSYECIIQGCSHRECSLRESAKNKKMTNEEVVKRIKSFNNDITVDFSCYNPNSNLLRCTCNVCNYIWDAKQRNLIRGRGCPNCAKIKRKNSRIRPFSYCQKVLDKFELDLLSDYIGASFDITVKCRRCGEVFKTTIAYLTKYKIGCKKCNELERTLEKEQSFLDILSELNPHIKMKSKFISMSENTIFHCEDCNKDFIRTPHDFTRTYTCPNCTTNSKLEYLTKIYLVDNNIDFELHKTYENLFGVNNGLLSFDFYLPKYNLLIELQGVQHYRPIDYFGGEEQYKIQCEHDSRKRDYAKLHNIDLIEIPYFSIDNIQAILNDKLNIQNNDKKSA
jgi:hypothetical protein